MDRGRVLRWRPRLAVVAYGSGVSLLPPMPSSLGPLGLTCKGICGAALLLGLRFAVPGVRFFPGNHPTPHNTTPHHTTPHHRPHHTMPQYTTPHHHIPNHTTPHLSHHTRTAIIYRSPHTQIPELLWGADSGKARFSSDGHHTKPHHTKPYHATPTH